MDALLSLGVVKKWVTPFDEVGCRYYAMARPGVRSRHRGAEAPGTDFGDKSSEVGFLDVKKLGGDD